MALYDAFVSYSHAKDKAIAAALQSGAPEVASHRSKAVGRERETGQRSIARRDLNSLPHLGNINLGAARKTEP